ncbi:hypothetical protein KVT40_008402 [Elsinoe batatas]|uniref:NACHT domain-containing protein n=1 Tax=Elsinoe batatas TaxID=2601811 RepID=A0A8K0KT45_9PEZI|nr:hypothetical protein KVT40_008402 [Elsinoe batatas]
MSRNLIGSPIPIRERGDTNFNNECDVNFQAGQYTANGSVYHGTVISNLTLNARRQRYLASLSFGQLGTREASVRHALKETCEWVVSRQEVIKWLEPDENERQKLLWIKGKPGTGKSTIVKFMCNRIKRSRKNAIVLNFFFNARGSNFERSTAGTFRALLHQLLVIRSDLQSIFDTCNVHLDQQGNAEWTVEVLQSLLSAAISQLRGQQIIIFIDALDECSEDDIRDMLDYFEDDLQEAIDFESVNLYLCLSSRHYPHIDINYGQELVVEDQSEHMQDIEKFIDNKLRIGKDALAVRIKRELLRRSSGVFIWVVLVVKALKREFDHGNKHKLLSELQRTPQTIDELLQDLLGRDTDDQHLLVSCVQWVLFAYEPLEVGQLYLGIITSTGSLPENLDGVSEEDMERFLLHCSRGLIELTPGDDGVMQFIHESVREFFLAGNDLTRYGFGEPTTFIGRSHDRIKDSCALFNARIFQLDHPPYDPSNDKDYSLDMFGYHTVENIILHSEAAQRHGYDQVQFIRNFDLPGYTRLIQHKKCFVHLPSRPTLRHVLVVNHAVNLPDLIEAQASDVWSTEIWGELDEPVSIERFAPKFDLTYYDDLLQPLDLKRIIIEDYSPSDFAAPPIENALEAAVAIGNRAMVRTLLLRITKTVAENVLGPNRGLGNEEVDILVQTIFALDWLTVDARNKMLSCLVGTSSVTTTPSAGTLQKCAVYCGHWLLVAVLVQASETILDWAWQPSDNDNSHHFPGTSLCRNSLLLRACKAGQWLLAKKMLMRPDASEHKFLTKMTMVPLALSEIGNVNSQPGDRKAVLKLLFEWTEFSYETSPTRLQLARQCLVHRDVEALEIINTMMEVPVEQLTIYERLQYLLLTNRWSEADYQSFKELGIKEGRGIVSSLVISKASEEVITNVLSKERRHFSYSEVASLRRAILEYHKLEDQLDNSQRSSNTFGYLCIARAAIHTDDLSVIEMLINQNLIGPRYGESYMELKIARALYQPLLSCIRQDRTTTLRAFFRSKYIHGDIRTEYTTQSLEWIAQKEAKGQGSRSIIADNYELSRDTRDVFKPQWNMARDLLLRQLENMHINVKRVMRERGGPQRRWAIMNLQDMTGQSRLAMSIERLRGKGRLILLHERPDCPRIEVHWDIYSKSQQHVRLPSGRRHGIVHLDTSHGEPILWLSE